MTYTVHSIFKTIQGEGVHLGRAAVFCRFAGCNLWSGREEDRESAICKFCDTEFRHGTKYQTANELAAAVAREWGPTADGRFIVLTGGEPALQYNSLLAAELRSRDFYIAMETNGTVSINGFLNWKTVSPKDGTELIQTTCNELKLVYPQSIDPEVVRSKIWAEHYILSPMDGPNLRENIAKAAAFVNLHPWWRLGIQAHKTWGLP